MSAPPASEMLTIACLCAQWCSACRAYRCTFDQVAAMFPQLRFLWVDVEDEAERVDPVEVENFPTLLIVHDGEPRFFGTVTPHKDTLLRLIRSSPATAPLPEPALHELAQRLLQDKDLGRT